MLRNICAVLWAAVWMFMVASGAAAQNHWPDFRGPDMQGHASAPAVPTTWSESSHIAWKTAIHGRGWSSPVVHGQQVWITTAPEDGASSWVVCVDARSGKILHDRKLWDNEQVEPLGNNVNNYAAPSPVIEAGRVYVHFGSYGTAAIDTATFATLWQRRDLPCRHFRGPGSSPILWNNLLILTMDGVDHQYLVALDKHTGQTVWRTDRRVEWDDVKPDGSIIGEGDFRKAYSTPIVVEVGGKPQLISAGAKAAFGYDPATGKELWRLTHKGFSCAARPVTGMTGGGGGGKQITLITTGHGKGELLALSLGGEGEVADQVAWRYLKNVPKRASPLIIDDLAYLVDDAGVMTCLELATGSEVWKQRVGTKVSASLLHVAGLIHVFGEDGKSAAIKPGRTWQVVHENKLDTGCLASPAVVGSDFIVRTTTHLYRITADSAADASLR